MSWQSHALALLSASLLRPFALAGGAWLLIRMFRIRHPSSRHAVWTAALLGMLLLPAVSILAPHWSLPLLPHQSSALARVGIVNPGTALPNLKAAPEGQLESSVRPSVAQPAPAGNLTPVAAAILATYFTGLSAMLLYWGLGWALLRRLVARANLLRSPRLRESDDLASPVTAGVIHPTVILPAGWRAWSADVRKAVLAHEFAHIRRHDGLTLALSRLVRTMFWFHPLAWWLGRRTTDLAELACDARVLEKTNDPAGYSRILIRFAEAVNRAGRRSALPGLAMAQPGAGLARRIDQLFELSGAPVRKLSRPGLLLFLVGLPVLCLAATAGLQAHGARKSAPATPLPHFDVVSIKPSPPGEEMVPDKPQQGGYWVVRSVPTAWLIYVTFETQPNLVVGMPVWAQRSRYDIEARMPPSTSDAQVHRMLQAMLADRFGMVWHTKMRPTEVTILSAAGSPGPDLHPARGHCLSPGESAPLQSDEYECGVIHAAESDSGVELAGSSVTLDDMATFLTRLRRRPVIAESGSMTLYDFTVTIPEPAPVQGESQEQRTFDLYRALQVNFRKQLGLDLNMAKTVKRPIPVLIIDHLAPASPN